MFYKTEISETSKPQTMRIKLKAWTKAMSKFLRPSGKRIIVTGLVWLGTEVLFFVPYICIVGAKEVGNPIPYCNRSLTELSFLLYKAKVSFPLLAYLSACIIC